MRFCAACGVPKKSGVARLFKVFASASLANFQEVYQRIPFPLSSVQFVLKRFAKILILQGFFGLFGTVLN